MKPTLALRSFLPIGAALGLALIPSSAHAATIIPIANAGFEAPGGSGFPQATSWSSPTHTALHSAFVRANSAGLGLSFGYNNPQDAATTQTIPEVFVANQTYTFKSFGVESSTPDSDIRFLIGWNNGGSFVELARATYDMNSITAWTELAGVSYTTGNSDAANGKNISVRIQAVGADGAGVWFDGASLTSIPEPSAALLGGLGMLALLRRRR